MKNGLSVDRSSSFSKFIGRLLDEAKASFHDDINNDLVHRITRMKDEYEKTLQVLPAIVGDSKGWSTHSQNLLEMLTEPQVRKVTQKYQGSNDDERLVMLKAMLADAMNPCNKTDIF